MSKRQRESIFKKQNGLCDICKKKLHIDKQRCHDDDYLQVDHILPQSKFKNVPSEWKRGLCKRCNSARSNYYGQKNFNVIKKHLEKTSLNFENCLLRINDDLRNKLITEAESSEIKKEVISKLQEIIKAYT